jgi:hypothetical protein
MYLKNKKYYPSQITENSEEIFLKFEIPIPSPSDVIGGA